jgi:Ca2+/Na+ antiporter
MKKVFSFIIIIFNIIIPLFIISFCSFLISRTDHTSFRIQRFNLLLLFSLPTLIFLIHKKKTLFFLILLYLLTFLFLYMINKCDILLYYNDWVQKCVP